MTAMEVIGLLMDAIEEDCIGGHRCVSVKTKSDHVACGDLIAKKRRGRGIPMHPDLRRALERLAQTVEPVGSAHTAART